MVRQHLDPTERSGAVHGALNHLATGEPVGVGIAGRPQEENEDIV